MATKIGHDLITGRKIFFQNKAPTGPFVFSFIKKVICYSYDGVQCLASFGLKFFVASYYLTLDCNPLLCFCGLSRILSSDVIIWVLYYSHVKKKVFQGFSPEIWTLTGTSQHLDSFLFESFSCRFTVVLGIIALLHEPISVKFELSDRWPHIGIFWYTNELMVNSVTLR